MAGMTWHYLQYCLGLKKLGHDVFYYEDSGDSEYCCYNPEKDTTDSNPAYGLNYASTIFETFGLKNNWAYFDKHTNVFYGTGEHQAKKIISESDVMINISIANPIRSWLEKIPAKILIDTDPVFTQIRNLSDPKRNALCSSHNYFFTFGENFGNKDCLIPDDGFNWKPTRQPIDLDAWEVSQQTPDKKWTTIMQWDSYNEQSFEGRTFGMKSKSFQQFIDIPQKINTENFLLATGAAPDELLNSHGWSVVNSLQISKTIQTYQDFITSSKGEFSVAKHGYASANSGWFSERSACYLASGKPVIMQETGYSKFLPTGHGLLPFDNSDEAINSIHEISSGYKYHCKNARLLAEEYFNSDKIMNDILNNL